MHLVFLNQYYPPDAAPTGVMLEGVVDKLVRDGHEVTVLCASGGYAEGVKRKTETLKAEMVEEEDAAGQNVEHRTSNIEHRISNIGHRTSNIEHRTSDIGHRTSDIGHRTSDIRHRTSK